MHVYNFSHPDRWQTLARTFCLLVWFLVILIPPAWLCLTLSASDWPRSEDLSVGRYLTVLARTCGLGAILATVSVLAAWPAARLIGANPWARKWGPLLLVIPLLVPPQINFYAWGLLALPTSPLGVLLAKSDSLLAFSALARSILALGLWYWPLCSLILGLGWQRTDPDVWAQARVDAGAISRWYWIGLPMLRNALILAWMIVFVLVLSQFVVFHLAAVDTLGTELASLYELTGNVHTVAWTALPLIIPAGVVSIFTDRFFRPVVQTFDSPVSEPCWRGHWLFAALLWTFSALVPVMILLTNIQGWNTFVHFGQLSWDALLNSLVIALVATILALTIAIGIVLQSRTAHPRLAILMRWATLLTALLPGSLLAAAMVFAFNRGVLTNIIYSRPWIVSIGHAAVFSILPLFIITWAQSSLPAQLADLARVDGAEGLRALVSIWLPGLWPAIATASLLTITQSITELSATMILLPPGVPNFAQQLLNQMHYARDQQVIASCLLLIFFAAAVTLAVFALSHVARMRVAKAAVPVIVLSLLAGCDDAGTAGAHVTVLKCFGGSGRAPAQFIYPRALTVAPDDTFFVVDKAARVQRLTEDGKSLGEWTMPEFQTGKPIGLYCSPDKKLYVADTHYHRVMVYAFDGKLLNKFGSFGKDPGQFIYPTDVDIAPDGRIFVSEYGGNDRINIFSPEGKFLKSFGSLGDAKDQFSRPSAICIDPKRNTLYVADACNHRIVLYNLEGKWLAMFGAPGQLPGQMRYPYDVNLLGDGSLVVAEYGNNRIQRFSPDGTALGVGGGAGREPGDVLYPWGVAADSRNRLIIVDSGNNRIQVWKGL